ncbi:MAG: TlpA family protein disulfide reductase [Prevotella sp.]|nr:TlpA family protein disulfide reductase [Prevotella sp.]
MNGALNIKHYALSIKHWALSIVLAALMPAMASAQRLPQVTLKTIDGRTVQVDTIANGGRSVIIDFFATWCKPCNRELDAISEVYDEWRSETGVRLVAVSIDQGQNINKVRPLVDAHGWEYDVLLDANGELKRALGVQMIPYVLIVDGRGNIVYRHNGYTDGAEQELIEKVREIAK